MESKLPAYPKRMMEGTDTAVPSDWREVGASMGTKVSVEAEKGQRTTKKKEIVWREREEMEGNGE